ncbi:Liver carboxylesterase 4 [Wickerhamomyces ciferrii]|uniref:Carboxylic ester hydrolase n=1 Tax=Wickerhamomyces ciferrii (strain ATCC 14091 / BCRC 22168 / CBS 111 / JCM 3599 / NBRC 0793 / NRRL Y-1031 F-60-10) TaxID=1206466 RepID=K0K780_WICCF|nr:Liver carboxylesterase 4 [Wickerhamomyces ciferrii]CCH40705.1 Liver carboxylesterase 4 [Wickerhamomyces ciferrii]
MIWNSIIWFTLIPSIFASSIVQQSQQQQNPPQVQIQNGTISGKYLESFNQDAYLGIPFAEPPINELRFQPPKSFQTNWNGTKNFTEYGYACFAQAGTDSQRLSQSEDCLTLNIVKPHGEFNDSLPVAIWIHGGGFTDGSGSRPSYNTSWIVQNSIEIGKPIIAITINYRLGGFGFLSSNQNTLQKWTNVGLRDQIQAIKWVHENIEGFGGNPNHIVLWGESAGSTSIGRLLTNDKLLGSYIKGGIMESGPSVFTNYEIGQTKTNQQDFQKLLEYFHCDESENYLECLQQVDGDELHKVFNVTNGILKKGFGYAYIDGDIVQGSAYDILESGEGFLKVPILIGTNTDEGTGFINQTLNTTEEVKGFLQSRFPNLGSKSADNLIDLYFNGNDTELSAPLDPTYNSTPIVYPEGFGKAYPKLSTLWGDVKYIAGSKFTAEFYSNQKIPVYKYRFNIPIAETIDQLYLGTAHYDEVVYVFDNQDPPTHRADGTTIFPHEQSSKVANAMSKLWISFIHDLDPNIENGDHKDSGVLEIDVPNWPVYKDGGEQIVFDLNGVYIEEDTQRTEQFEYIRKIIHQLDG